MNHKRHFALLPLILAACLVFSGCGAVSGLVKGKTTAAPSGVAAIAGTTANQAGGTVAPKATAAPAAGDSGFADAFQTVEKNPLHESVQIALWLAANAADDPGTEAAGSSAAMKELAGKYAAVVADQGLHYVEKSDALGIQVEIEYWIKDGKFKKWDGYDMVLFDGEHYIKYNPEDKTGTRFDGSYATADLQLLTKGMLANVAVSPYVQKEDAKVGKFTCSVFHMDTEMSMFGMTFKGNTLYVDKATGLIVKNQTGDPKDKKNSFAATVESVQVGGFGDDVFTVPEGIKLSDY